MDYEKKYNEALKDMRAIYPNLKGDARLAVEHAFPELAESEDERIRKEIVGYLNSRVSTAEETELLYFKRWISYLEKQKEPHYTKRNALFDKCVAECDPTVMKEVSDEIDEMLEKEQKPNFSEKDSTDFEIEVHEIIAQARNDSRLDDADVLKQFEEEAAFALMLKANKLIEQKPAEWSEEDENALKYLHELISFGYTEKFFDAQTAADMREWVNEKLKKI